ncbi:MAG: aminotransferase class I/II-fold pyridoxal phosphate-dependent enzyme [Acidaminococcaceae bacterium]|nr:aminotransferase class I/II-fold pyridoxal phosphate-dependent enzyme [Acidaminococcaceae bacterium]
MYTSFAAPQAKGKAANDNIFAANAMAVADAAAIGADKVTNGTIGAIMDDEGRLVCLPTVEAVFRYLPVNEIFAYAPIAGLPEFLDKVQVAAFGDSRPKGYISAVATAGGTGGIHHAIWNYTEAGDTIITSDWYWGAYKVLCLDMGRKLDTYKMLTDGEQFNLPALEAKVNEVLARQNSIMVIINTPAHNPTGYSLTREDMAQVVAMLKKVTEATGKQAILFLDAAYIDYAGEKNAVRKVFEALDDLPERVLAIVQYSMSKGFTMYGQRVGAMIGVAASEAAAQEFFDINQYTSRATWSNINRSAMRTLAQIYSDEALLTAVEAERDHYYKMIKARADIFVKEAKECGLPMIPYIAGFFLSVPCDNPQAVCDMLHEEHIYLVPLAAGVRIALCSIPIQKIPGIATKLNNALKAVEAAKK